MIEGSLLEGEREPRNVQVRLTEEEETLRVIELVGEEGPFCGWKSGQRTSLTSHQLSLRV